MWRFVKVLLAAFIVFAVVNFFLSNTSNDAHSLASTISFKFNVPPFFYLESMDFTVGYLLILGFTLGMVFTAMIGGINAFFRLRELKMKKRTIQELEKEINELRELVARQQAAVSTSIPTAAAVPNEVPIIPEIR